MTTNNHHLHYRTGLSLLKMDFLQKNTRFMDVDYVFLYTPHNNCFSGYLTQEGLAQMRKLGMDRLHNNPNWEEIFADAKERFPKVDALKTKEAPHIMRDEFHPFWEEIKDHMFVIANSYIFCDQPTVAALEELAHERRIYDQLERIGRHKLEAHKRLSILEGILDGIIRQCSKIHLIPVSDIEMMTLEEFGRLLKEKDPTVVPEAVHHRKKGYVWRKEQGRWIIETGDAYHTWTAHLLPSEDMQSVSGLVTYAVPKPVIGTAKLHLSFSGTTDIPKGTVLVTGMTNPQLVPMLKNAVAIVADEGGLMCHAAIISRELKIPCIVGTKDATQIFKNGDTVQVDTQTGTATKLN